MLIPPAAAIDVTSVSPSTCVGIGLEVLVPFPSWPAPPPPHAQTVPLDFRARLWLPPVAIATTSASPSTTLGSCSHAMPNVHTGLPAVPIWPAPFAPHATTR